MRTKDGPLRVLTPLAAAIFMMATCAGCSSNSYDRQMETCTGIGAAIGAMAGGGSGLAIRMYTRGSHRTVGDIPRDNLIGWGVVGGAIGALVGGGIGHAVCQPTEAPRTVTYYGTPSSATTSSTTTTGGNP
jgi:hypothetical protein